MAVNVALPSRSLGGHCSRPMSRKKIAVGDRVAVRVWEGRAVVRLGVVEAFGVSLLVVRLDGFRVGREFHRAAVYSLKEGKK